ncbi:MAG: hypothetical protein P8077_08565 [Gammaproteobacteria bacterium]
MSRAVVVTIFLTSIMAHDCAFARASWGVYTQIESVTYSEAMSIDGFIDNFSGTLEVGQSALTHDLAEIGVQYGPWRVGRVLRYDYDLAFSYDTALLNYQIERGQILDAMVNTNRGALNEEAIARIEGLAPEYKSRVDDIETADDLVVLGDELLQVSADIREVVVTSTLQGVADYYYYEPALREDERDEFSDVALFGPRGEGFTLDVALRWQINARWGMKLDIRDWYSRIVWQNSPATTASFTATQAAIQALDMFDQFVEQDIIRRFSGQFFQATNSENQDDPAEVVPDILAELSTANSSINVRNERFIQKLTSQTRFSTHYTPGSWWAISGYVEDYHTYTFWHVRADFGQWIGVEWYPDVQAFGLELYHRLAKIRLVTDSSDVSSAKYLSLVAAFSWYF